MTALEKIKERIANGRFAEKKYERVIVYENSEEKSKKRCMPEGDVIYHKELGDDSRIIFYENGVVRYVADGKKTTFPIDSCDEIQYKYEHEIVTIGEKELQGDEDWLLRFIIEGENRLMNHNEHNAQFGLARKDGSGKYHKQYNIYYEQLLDDDNSHNRLLSSEDDGFQRILPDVFDEIRDYLTELQYKVIVMYFKDQMSLQEIADVMGVTYQAVSKTKKAAMKKIKKFYTTG